MSDVNETLQELLDRRLQEMGGRDEPRTLRSAYLALPQNDDWVSYEVVRRVSKGHARITERAARTLATMLGLDEDVVRQAAGQRPKMKPFVLPPRADRLNESERGVVISVVDAILAAAEGAARPSIQSDKVMVGSRAGLAVEDLTQHEREVLSRLHEASGGGEDVEGGSAKSAGPGDMSGQHNVTQLPTAEALDPTLPGDVAARSEKGKGKSQEARERQDIEGEAP